VSPLATFGLILFFLAAVAFIAWDFLRDLATFLYPEGMAERRLRRRFGEDSPEYHKGTARLEAPGGEGRVIALGLAGLLGMLVTIWIVFR
jgi:hypothetical protein